MRYLEYGEPYHVACASYATMESPEFETSRRAMIELAPIAVSISFRPCAVGVLTGKG
jgi:hypothetical protein